MDDARIGSLKVALMTATPVAPLIGFVDNTVGGVVSGGPLMLSSPPHPAISTAKGSASSIVALRIFVK
jgi:hypothetical protein